MEEIKVFLSALSKAMKNKRGLFIPKLLIKPTRFNAIKAYCLEVWIVDGDYKECISSIESNINVTSQKDKSKAINSIIEDTIVNILNRYGIQ